MPKTPRPSPQVPTVPTLHLFVECHKQYFYSSSTISILIGFELYDFVVLCVASSSGHSRQMDGTRDCIILFVGTLWHARKNSFNRIKGGTWQIANRMKVCWSRSSQYVARIASACGFLGICWPGAVYKRVLQDRPGEPFRAALKYRYRTQRFPGLMAQ